MTIAKKTKGKATAPRPDPANYRLVDIATGAEIALPACLKTYAGHLDVASIKPGRPATHPGWVVDKFGYIFHPGAVGARIVKRKA
jgi:hypothetical protein